MRPFSAILSAYFNFGVAFGRLLWQKNLAEQSELVFSGFSSFGLFLFYFFSPINLLIFFSVWIICGFSKLSMLLKHMVANLL